VTLDRCCTATIPKRVFFYGGTRLLSGDFRPPPSPQGRLIQTYANIFTSTTLCLEWQQYSPSEGHLNELSAQELWPHRPTAAALFQGAFNQPTGWHQAVRSHHDNDHTGYPKDESVNHICELNLHSYSADFCPYHRFQFTPLNIFAQVWPLESDSVTNQESGQLGASIPHDITHC